MDIKQEPVLTITEVKKDPVVHYLEEAVHRVFSEDTEGVKYEKSDNCKTDLKPESLESFREEMKQEPMQASDRDIFFDSFESKCFDTSSSLVHLFPGPSAVLVTDTSPGCLIQDEHKEQYENCLPGVFRHSAFREQIANVQSQDISMCLETCSQVKTTVNNKPDSRLSANSSVGKLLSNIKSENIANDIGAIGKANENIKPGLHTSNKLQLSATSVPTDLVPVCLSSVVDIVQPSNPQSVQGNEWGTSRIEKRGKATPDIYADKTPIVIFDPERNIRSKPSSQPCSLGGVMELYGQICSNFEKTVCNSGKESYKCKSCDECFINLHEMDYHSKLHSRFETITCDLCNEVLLKEASCVNRHTRSHRVWEKTPFKCNVCKEIVPHVGIAELHFASRGCRMVSVKASLSNIKETMKDIHDNLFQCVQCLESFEDAEVLSKHSQIHKKYKCKDCNKRFVSKNHFKMHKDKRTESGSQCSPSRTLAESLAIAGTEITERQRNRSSSSKARDESLMAVGTYNSEKQNNGSSSLVAVNDSQSVAWTDTTERQNNINSSPTTFDNSSAVIQADLSTLSEHTSGMVSICTAESNSNADETRKLEFKPYMCSLCFSHLTCLAEANAHAKVHDGKKSFSCTVCNSTFLAAYKAEVHMMVHGERIQCRICGMTGTTIDDMEEHYLKEHISYYKRSKPSPKRKLKEKIYECKVCSKCFGFHKHLYQHMKCIHALKKQYKCGFCDKSFDDRKGFQLHTKTHGKKPYRCTECEKCFPSKCRLQDHIRTHSGEKPYQCTVCGKCYRIKQLLRCHMRLHTGEYVVW